MGSQTQKHLSCSCKKLSHWNSVLAMTHSYLKSYLVSHNQNLDCRLLHCSPIYMSSLHSPTLAPPDTLCASTSKLLNSPNIPCTHLYPLYCYSFLPTNSIKLFPPPSPPLKSWSLFWVIQWGAQILYILTLRTIFIYQGRPLCPSVKSQEA